MEGNIILAIISEYGTSVIIAAVIFYILWLLLSAFLQNKFKNLFISSDKKDRNKKKEDLKYHSFFTNVQYRLVAEIPSLEILPEKPVKERMFKDFIAIETRIILDMCQNIISFDMDDWSSEQWQTEISRKVNEMILAIATKAKEEGIPEVVIHKYNKWHSASFDMLADYVQTLATSPAYDDNISRTWTLLIIMNLMIITTIADAEKSLKELNGEVAGKQYKGMTLED